MHGAGLPALSPLDTILSPSKVTNGPLMSPTFLAGQSRSRMSRALAPRIDRPRTQLADGSGFCALDVLIERAAERL